MTRASAESLPWDELGIREVLELAIADEVDAREFYTRAAALSGNIHTQRMLLRLAAMEEEHAAALREELDDLLAQHELEAGIAD